MRSRVASAPDDVKLSKLNSSASLRPLRVTSSSAAALGTYAESGAFGVGHAANTIKPASMLVRLDAQLFTCPPNRGKLTGQRL